MSVFVLFGCVGTKSGAYKVFSEDLERLSGTSISSAYVHNIGYLSTLKPDRAIDAKGGNKILSYSVKPPRKNSCTVHVEVDRNGVIAGVTSEGPDCWRAY